jgi:hypothetical protein
VTHPLALLRVEPTSYADVLAFRGYTDGSGDVGPVRVPVYPRSTNGARLREERRALGMLSPQIADRLGLRALDVVYLEQGNYTLSDEDWARVFEVLRAVREERGG